MYNISERMFFSTCFCEESFSQRPQVVPRSPENSRIWPTQYGCAGSPVHRERVLDQYSWVQKNLAEICWIWLSFAEFGLNSAELDKVGLSWTFGWIRFNSEESGSFVEFGRIWLNLAEFCWVLLSFAEFGLSPAELDKVGLGSVEIPRVRAEFGWVG